MPNTYDHRPYTVALAHLPERQLKSIQHLPFDAGEYHTQNSRNKFLFRFSDGTQEILWAYSKNDAVQHALSERTALHWFHFKIQSVVIDDVRYPYRMSPVGVPEIFQNGRWCTASTPV